jgi:hypothetical protein
MAYQIVSKDDILKVIDGFLGRRLMAFLLLFTIVFSMWHLRKRPNRLSRQFKILSFKTAQWPIGKILKDNILKVVDGLLWKCRF